MWFISLLWNTFYTNIFTAIISLFISLVVYNLLNLYLQVYNLPPGPLPLPLLGNALLFRSKDHWDEIIRRLEKRYGTVFTVWMGNCPIVFVTDVEIAREAYRKNDFAGRKSALLASFISNETHQDVILTDFGVTWETLRKVTHSTSIKYSTNEKLIYFVSDCVDTTFKLMFEKEGINNAFNPIDYISLIFLNIISCSAFGNKYSLNDPEFKKITDVLYNFAHRVGPRQGLWEFSFLFRLLDRNIIKKHKEDIDWLTTLVKNKFIDHYKDYSESIERDFCDALITTKNKAIRESKESAPILTDANLGMCVFDLFAAGYDTSQYTFRWLLLFLCYYPEFQEKLRQEIDTQIGDRIATHEDKNRCHYVMAFMFEAMRFKNVPSTGTPHKAVVNSKIGDYTIPKGTGVFLYQGITLTEEKNFENSHEFRPERFLENGMLTTRPKPFIPFGVGRRVCLGEKLAIADLFLVLVRFIQLTSNYKIVLGQNNGLKPNNKVMGVITPDDYQIIFKSK